MNYTNQIHTISGRMSRCKLSRPISSAANAPFVMGSARYELRVRLPEGEDEWELYGKLAVARRNYDEERSVLIRWLLGNRLAKREY